MKILSLNCQRSYRKLDLENFLAKILTQGEYDFICLQEVIRDTGNLLDSLVRKCGYRMIGDYQNTDSVLEKRIIFRENFVHTFDKDYVFNCLNGRRIPGFVIGGFKVGKKLIMIGTVHLHAHPQNLFLRRDELNDLERISRELELRHKPDQIILCGDFNSMVPFEQRFIHDRIMANKFMCVEGYHGGSYESRYFEISKGGNVGSKFLNLLGRLGINISLKLDKFYISTTIGDYKISKIEERVSDHSPIVLEFDDTQNSCHEVVGNRGVV